MDLVSPQHCLFIDTVKSSSVIETIVASLTETMPLPDDDPSTYNSEHSGGNYAGDAVYRRGERGIAGVRELQPAVRHLDAPHDVAYDVDYSHL